MPAVARERVLEAARTLAGRGEAFTLGEVAVGAGVSRATVHRLFGSREALLGELEVEIGPGSRERALEAAGSLLAERPFSDVSMDEVAERAGLSRASLYRLFPGRPALFRELVRRYSPLEPVAEVLAALPERPPAEVMPAIARAVAKRLEGRAGLVRSLISEVAALTEDTREARQMAAREAMAPALAYVMGQMAAGRLRPVPPLLAMQSFVGPLAIHLLTRDLARELIGYTEPLEQAIDGLVAIWLRGMAPEPAATNAQGGDDA